MAIRRWDPWRDLLRMQEDLSKTFERAFGPSKMQAPAWVPEADIYEKEGKIVITLDVPEVKPEEIEISIVDQTLKIKGERKKAEEIKEEDYYRMERSYGSFERIIELPVGVRTEEVDAKYKDGVLTVTLPKAEEKKAKEVQVRVA
ncbi:MAG: Hsp20/alpha crystallin family protein [Candidatus Aquicultorales bacterium]